MNIRTFIPVLSLLVISASACTTENSGSYKLFELRSPAESGINFVNTIHEDNTLFNLVDYYYIYNGGGVAVGDINNDSLPDIYFSGNMVQGSLYLNRGQLRFEDITESAGLTVDGWATGVTFADVNADGFLDLYVSRAGPLPASERSNLLFINNGDLTFSEQAAQFGIADTNYTTQATFFDYDKDGDLDLFLLNHSNEEKPNLARPLVTDGTGISNDRLFRQVNDGTFTDVTTASGIVFAGPGLGVGVSDLDGDGWEDIYVANDFMAHDFIYFNNRDGTFTERGGDVLKHNSFASMGTDLADVNNDGLLDIIVVDMRPPDNEQQKRQAYAMTEQGFNMSLRAGFHPQYWRNVLQLNNGLNPAGKLTFSDIGQFAGVDATGWSWSPLVADFDNDGLKDIWITNGYRRAAIDMDFINSYVQLQIKLGLEVAGERVKEMSKKLYDLARSDYVYRNRGDLTFEQVSGDWGISQPSFSNGATYSDLDNDGDLDVVINNIDMPAALYENRSQNPSFLKIYLQGSGKNRNGLGTVIRLYCGGQMQYYQHYVTRGYQSSTDQAIHFGLGACEVADSLRVTWPNGDTQQLTYIPANQVLNIRQDEAHPEEQIQPEAQGRSGKRVGRSGKILQGEPVRWRNKALPNAFTPILSEAGTALGLDYRHKEVAFNDFKNQRLLPHKHSRQGPGIAVGDVNGDGEDDVFIGGAFRQSGYLAVQQKDGSFEGKPLESRTPKYEEDLGALFFDADGDGDVDLYVVSGSSEYGNGDKYLQDRLYHNDGSGNFTLAEGALPDLRTSSSTVLAADYDRDGDLDLFVGGRLRPLRYPMPGISYLLRNDDGIFTDVTASIAASLGDIGMVTGGLWTDFNNDGLVDLVLVGEFMPIRFFENTGDIFRDVTDNSGISQSVGWWNSITGGDFDHDGDTDYVAGNLGLNTRFRASQDEPVTVHGQDFDLNGHIDPVLTQFIQGVEYPVARWDDFSAQIPEQKLFLQTYERYAKSTFEDLFPPQRRQGGLTLRATYFESSYIENLGNGRFSLHALPDQAQWGPVFGLISEDIDDDGNLDILAVGNSYSPDVITGRYDALIGLYLRGNGLGQFLSVPHQKSGFFVDGDAKGLVSIQGATAGPMYLASQNDGPIRLFRYTAEHKSVTVATLPLDAQIIFTFDDGSNERRELYYGSGYLSQSSRRVNVPGRATTASIYRFDGTSREILLDLPRTPDTGENEQ